MRRARGFTLIEVLVVMAIIIVVSGIVIVAVRGARIKAKNSVCLVNLSQIGKAASLYAGDFDDYLPHIIMHTDLAQKNDDGENGMRYRALMAPYGVAEAQWFCPLDPVTDLAASRRGIPRQVMVNLNSLGRVDSSYHHSLLPFLKHRKTGSPSLSLTQIEDSAKEPHVMDAPVGVAELESGRRATTAHGVAANAVFFDGHVASIR